jgi:putative ATPase
MTGLFDNDPPAEPNPGSRPLADRMRPDRLEDLLGQSDVVGPGTALRQAIERDQLGSIILWGPPGCGKTTLGRIVARRTRAEFVPFSAVTSGIKEVREIMERAGRLRRSGRRTILFVDEIHRFNKAQQDAFLPHVERGTVTLIGATTQNPSFEINPALLSRSRVYRLDRLGDDALLQLMRRALKDPDHGLGGCPLEFPEELLLTLARHAQGDARAALNLLEFTVDTASERHEPITEGLVRDALQNDALYYDRAGEEHFNLISALHKSMRNSDADASLYWLARMLEAGEDPLYIARRIVRFASEDIGLADPRALPLTISAKETVRFVGLPEAELALAQAAAYCALAPKSNALYRAWGVIRKTVQDGSTDPVPMPLRNAPTGLMKREGYGRGYEYAHDHDDGVTGMECLPSSVAGRTFYQPAPRGFERVLARRVERLRKLRERLRKEPGD